REQSRQLLVSRGIVVATDAEVEAPGEVFPGLLVERGARGELLDFRGHLLAELLVGKLGPAIADQREVLGQEGVGGEVEDRRPQQTAGQIARRPKDDEDTGVAGRNLAGRLAA